MEPDLLYHAHNSYTHQPCKENAVASFTKERERDQLPLN